MQPSQAQQASMSAFLSTTSSTAKKWKSTDGGKQREITDAIVLCSCRPTISFGCRKPCFRKILEKPEPQYTMPSRKHLSSKLIPKRYEDLFSKIVSLLHRAPQVCLTLDIWTNRQIRSYLGVTAHLIIDFTLIAVMLACHLFQGCHTGEEILVRFAEIERAFEVTGKVDSIITDSASNMLKAFRLLEVSESTDSDDEDELEAVEIDNNLQD